MTTETPTDVATSAIRRQCLQALGSLLLTGFAEPLLAQSDHKMERLKTDSRNGWAVAASNFHGIYDDEPLRAHFGDFLRHVYSIFPPDKFHTLIAEVSRQNTNDKDIYLTCQRRLGEITPMANQVRNALPALLSQTEVVGRQLLRMLDGRSAIDGYMEIGTKGGYIGYAQSRLTLRGDLVLLNTEAASYALGDLFERRVVRKIGRFVDLNDYRPLSNSAVATASLDVVCNPIGFHHSPLERRDEFVSSLRRCLRKGGLLIVRDHDVHSPAMNQMVALAHDVFNMGLIHPWMHNQQEIRNFTSLRELGDYLAKFGFRPTGQALYQAGDPTLNAMIGFVAT
ncbi:MAG: dehydrogenase [Pseudomonadota bacterium]